MSAEHQQLARAQKRGAAAVIVTPRPLWRLRLARELPRHLLRALATLGLLATARYAIDPPTKPTLPLGLVRGPARASGETRPATGCAAPVGDGGGPDESRRAGVFTPPIHKRKEPACAGRTRNSRSAPRR